jgi:uncharacterized membrane protein YoaK (UPF0700 family)
MAEIEKESFDTDTSNTGNNKEKSDLRNQYLISKCISFFIRGLIVSGLYLSFIKLLNNSEYKDYADWGLAALLSTYMMSENIGLIHAFKPNLINNIISAFFPKLGDKNN